MLYCKDSEWGKKDMEKEESFSVSLLIFHGT
jgi:hypothetical protein